MKEEAQAEQQFPDILPVSDLEQGGNNLKGFEVF